MELEWERGGMEGRREKEGRERSGWGDWSLERDRGRAEGEEEEGEEEGGEEARTGPPLPPQGTAPR